MAAGEFVRLESVAEELGISITPVREGLQVLAGEGLLTFEPRRGFSVVPLTSKDVEDLFLVQADIAGELAARAASASDDGWVEELTGLQRALESAVTAGAVEEAVVLNRRFHQAINRSADAPKLAWMLSVAVRFAPEQLFARIEGWPAASVHDHGEVLAALAARDPIRARAAMRAHILHAGRLLAQHLRDQD